MATKNGQLESAVATLINTQAAFVSHLRETYDDVVKIKGDLQQIKAILLRHERVLNELPEAIRQKVGFKPGR